MSKSPPSPPRTVTSPETPAVPATVVSIEVGRVFDVPEAWLVRDAIARAPKDVKVALDFRRTAEMHDFALAVLVQTLARMERPVEFRGLGKHHQSLLKMLGTPVSNAAQSGR